MGKILAGALIALALIGCSGPRKKIEELKHEIVESVVHEVMKELKPGRMAEVDALRRQGATQQLLLQEIGHKVDRLGRRLEEKRGEEPK